MVAFSERAVICVRDLTLLFSPSLSERTMMISRHGAHSIYHGSEKGKEGAQCLTCSWVYSMYSVGSSY